MSKRKVFYSFHYENDHWRANQVRQMGRLEGNQECQPNAWESIKRQGNDAIKRWINNNLIGTSCTIVLVGSDTVNRPWISYEIEESWKKGNGLLGIHIHGLQDRYKRTSLPGDNPFRKYTVGGYNLSDVVKCYGHPIGAGFGSTSQDKYNYIANNIKNWVEEALEIRATYP